MNKSCFAWLLVCATVVLFSVIEAQGNESALVEFYGTKIIKELVLKDDSLESALQKLTESTDEIPIARSIGVVLVQPSAELLQKRITKEFHQQSLKAVLEELCAIAGLHYTLDFRAIIVGGKGVDLSKKGLRLELPRKREFLEAGHHITLPNLMLRGTDFSVAVKMVEDMSLKYNATGKPFRVESKLRFSGAEPKVYGWFPYVDSGDAIEYFCMSAGLRYSCPSEGLYILLNK